MWFRNARIFRFTKPFGISAEALEAGLKGDTFVPCGPQETSRQGWVSPLGKHGETLVHSAGGYHLICLCREEKILPGPVIKELVEEKVEAIEHEQGRKVRRKEKDEIKEQVMLEMLPRAFSRSKRCFAYIDCAGQFLVVDANTARVAEDFASHLRKSLGSLPVRPPAVKQAPAFTLTGWLNETIDLPGTLVLGDECELKDPSEDGGVVRCKGLDLQGDEIRSHLDAGMQATRVTLTWEDNLSFVLDEELGITRLRFGDAIQEKLDDVDADDAVARFDAAFALMTLELSRMIPGLLDVMGGEDRSAIADAAPIVISDSSTAVETATAIAESVALYGDKNDDALYPEAVQLVTETRRVSISGIQRKFKIGYNRAAHLVEAMEANEVVSPAGHNGTREVLAPPPETAEE